MTWRAKIEAPQHGPIFVHFEEARTIRDLLGLIRSGYDFERADNVTITITRHSE